MLLRILRRVAGSTYREMFVEKNNNNKYFVNFSSNNQKTERNGVAKFIGIYSFE